MKKTILVIGTYDTKNDELSFISKKIVKLGGNILTMDVSVLGDPVDPIDISKSARLDQIGVGCSVCERMDCTQRAHPPIGHELRFDGPMRRIGLYDLGTKGTNSK